MTRTVEDRIGDTLRKLGALAHLLTDADDDHLNGLGAILDDIHDDLAPIREAPASVANWEPDEADQVEAV